MKPNLIIVFILVIGFLGSCAIPIEVFQIESDFQQTTLKLYGDSTFIEEVTETEDYYQYSGTWSGELAEGKSFKTISTQKGIQIITSTPEHEYQIINGKAIEKKNFDKAKTIESFNSIQSDYSEDFLKHFDESNLTLKSDSILFPETSGVNPLFIPVFLSKNQEVKFEDEDEEGNSITARQINYTDIEFSIEYENQVFNGKASLSPHFYLGMESVGFSDGEYEITHYYVIETEFGCIDYIGLGNQNIAKEHIENVYALISVSGDSCENVLSKLINKKLKTVANNSSYEKH